jgi:hypothetical protein
MNNQLTSRNQPFRDGLDLAEPDPLSSSSANNTREIVMTLQARLWMMVPWVLVQVELV